MTRRSASSKWSSMRAASTSNTATATCNPSRSGGGTGSVSSLTIRSNMVRYERVSRLHGVISASRSGIKASATPGITRNVADYAQSRHCRAACEDRVLKIRAIRGRQRLQQRALDLIQRIDHLAVHAADFFVIGAGDIAGTFGLGGVE